MAVYTHCNSNIQLHIELRATCFAYIFSQEKDRGSMTKQESSETILHIGGDENRNVELTAMRKLTTEDSGTVTPSTPPSLPSPQPSSEDGGAEKSLATAQGHSDGGTTEEGGEGESDEQERGEGESDEQERGEGESEEVRAKRGTQRAISQQLQRPESLEIDDQLASPGATGSGRNPRKSVLRKREPTPVHAGPTYTSTSPVGEPYDSEGRKRSGGSRECCSVM